MAIDANIGGLKALEKLQKIKQREVFCPVAGVRAITKPLMTIDDLSLRTSILSADLYDVELSKLLFKHVTFPELSGDITYEFFTEGLSYIDRRVLIWGVFASTYGSLGNRNIKCPNPNCEYVFKNTTITAEDIIQEDSFQPWQENAPFAEFIHTIEEFIPINDDDVKETYKITVKTSLPNIKQHLQVLKLIPPEKLKENYEKFNTILSKAEELCSITRSITLHKSAEDPTPDVWTTPRDLHFIISKYIPIDLSDRILESFNERFNKYVPRFYTPMKCPECGETFDYVSDPEVALFRQFLGE